MPQDMRRNWFILPSFYGGGGGKSSVAMSQDGLIPSNKRLERGAMAKILLATGDSALQSILEAELTGDGHELNWVTDGKEACDTALTLLPDVVFLDLTLPIFNGLETCVMMREDPELPARMPIILITDEEVNVRLLEKNRVTELFPKTHSANELRDLVVKLLTG
jgi:DNA-binding response OmpR family regulator